jgi:hypothetical protein
VHACGGESCALKVKLRGFESLNFFVVVMNDEC